MELIGHVCISFLPMAIPLSCLFAVIYTMNKLSGDSEFMAMRSFGLSKGKVYRPLLGLSVLIALASFALNQNIIPISKREFKKALITLTSKGYLADIRPGKFFTDIPGIVLYTTEASEDGQNLKNVFIESTSGGGVAAIFAKRGKLSKDEINKWGLSNLRLKLFDGNILKKNVDGTFEKIFYHTYDFPISEGKLTGVLVTKDSMRTSRELYDLMSLSSQEKANRGLGKRQVAKTKLEFWTRINTPFICIIFVFLGFSLGVKNTRGKSRNTGVITLVILLLYYGSFFGGVSIARSGNVPAVLAVFVPTVITFFFALHYYRRLEWVD